MPSMSKIASHVSQFEKKNKHKTITILKILSAKYNNKSSEAAFGVCT